MPLTRSQSKRQQHAEPQSSAPSLTSSSGVGRHTSMTSASSRSSATVLEIEAQFARKKQELDLEMERKRTEREIEVLELEKRAAIARALEGRSQRSRTSRGRSTAKEVERWLNSCVNVAIDKPGGLTTMDALPGRPATSDATAINRSGNPPGPVATEDTIPGNTATVVGTSVRSMYPKPVAIDDEVSSHLRFPFYNAPIPSRNALFQTATHLQPLAGATTSARPSPDVTGLCVDAPHRFVGANTSRSLGVTHGSAAQHSDDGIIRLVGALEKLTSRPKLAELPTFDGRSQLDWLMFKRAFVDTEPSCSATENLARLNRALKGAAREVVGMLLVTAHYPADVMDALDRRYGRPEQIVLQEVAAIRALPKVNHEVRDLTVFASRVRNCVEVVKLLQHDDYMRSPELFGALLSKLPPLLRTRWIDYASSRVGAASSYVRVQLLSDFLAREVDLNVKFGSVLEPITSHIPRERAHSTTIHHQSSSSPSHQSHKISCIICKKDHNISSCEKFLAMSPGDRWQFIKKHKVCYRCLENRRHSFRSCRKEKDCINCQRRHHTLLHDPTFSRTTTLHVTTTDPSPHDLSSDPPSPSSSSLEKSREIAAHTTIPDAVFTAGVGRTLRPLLKIIAVTVSGPAGSVDTYALLDDGSTATLIDSDLSTRIGATGPEGHVHLDCVGGLSMETSIQFVDFKIKGQHTPDVFEILRARSIKNLGLCDQSVTSDKINSYPHLSDLSNELCYESATPMLVIGIDNWHLSIASATRYGSRSQPVAIRTLLGWVVFGFASSKTKTAERIFHAAVTDEIDPKLEFEEMIKEQYRLDSIGITKCVLRSANEQRALQILERTTRRLPSGRLECGLLWKSDNSDVPDSFPLALSRFKSLERKMIADPAYANRYRQNIHDTLTKDYAEECTSLKPTGVCWYLPHFGVINPNKPQKLRVVHDAAAKSGGVSLNSLLLTGPDLLRPSLGILMRFREGQIALTADIREMFPQVKIREEDRDAQRFIWRDSPSDPITIFRMSSMIFGACSSPATAIFMTNYNASEFRGEFPEAVDAIASDTYMDDYIASVDGVDHAAHLAGEIVTVHKRGGFEMRGWTSNAPAALSTLPKELLSDLANPDVGLNNASSRTLGLIWRPTSDTLTFNVGLKTSFPVTKRQALTQVMRVYDPLGVLAPIVVKGRILFQNLWRKGLGWDEKLSSTDMKVWQDWYNSLHLVSELIIPRWYNSSNTDVTERELHIFCDASEMAYAAVVYWRFIYANDDIKLVLVASKARVAPLKSTSIPRLELQGALMATRLATYVVASHRHKPSKRFFWCDSMAVLGWLRSDARNFKPFVANRVGEILENSTLEEWRWVPGELNVADDATRTKFNTLLPESRWLAGPQFLKLDSYKWPCELSGEEPQIITEELKPSALTSYQLCCHNSSADFPLPLSADPSRFSSWLRFIRVTARAHQFLDKIKNKNRSSFTQSLTADEITRAETHVLKKSQLESFYNEYFLLSRQRPIPNNSRLATLSPGIAEDGLLRVFGRITAASDVDYGLKRPVILDGRSPAARLLIRHYHTRSAHANTETVINEIRQVYWVLGLRNAVRSIVRTCQKCKLLRGSTLRPPMGDLPEARLAHHKRPFTFVGVDYFGPLQVTVGRRREKRWVALFTCLVTRAIHVDVVYSLSSDAAVMCLRRFVARRGTPTEIFSDNGTNFVGANREMRALYSEAEDYAANLKIKWTFIPPSAPFMGGAWERLVKSVKVALRATLNERAPRDEILVTLLAEAEALVNSRPLTQVSPDHDHPEALTPFHFLLGSSSGRPIPAHLTDADLCSRTGWKKALRLADHFWQRWIKEYLPSLSPRRLLGNDNNIVVDTPVLIADGNLPRGIWPRGVVTALFPGRDGVVRVAEVRTTAGTLKRPVRKLVPL